LIAQQILACILDNPSLLFDLPFPPSELDYPAGEILGEIAQRVAKGLPAGSDWALIKFTQHREYLIEAIQNTPPKSFFLSLVNTFKADLLRRKLRSLSNYIVNNLESREPDNLLADLEERLKGIRTGDTPTEAAHIGDILHLVTRRIEDGAKGKHPWIPTGVKGLDRLLGGLWPGSLYVIAGRPGMGKTAFALSLAEKLVGSGSGVLFLSLEMSNVELLTRLVAMHSKISHHLMRIGQLSVADMDNIIQSCLYLSSQPFYVTDRSSLGIAELRREITRMKRTKDIKVVVVDYLQRIALPSEYVGNTDSGIGAVCKALKTIALDNDISLVLLAQLNRQVEALRERKPELHHLRESGNIEQEADVVAFLYREAYYSTGERVSEPHPVEVLVRKNRHGPIGTAKLIFDPQTMRFEE